jgi:ribosomal protein S18 acetylase RimI-like enzyme
MTIKNPSAELVSDLWNLWREAFGDSGEFLDDFFTHAYSADRCLCALEENELQAAVYWFDCELRGKKIAYLYALATGMAHRGHGIAHTLIEHVHSHLEQQGYEGVVLVPGESNLVTFYETMGYRTCTQRSEFFCMGAADEVQLRKVTAEEYAKQRRDLFAYIEPGGVLQEGENMAFLATQADFYIGQNCLLAARGEGDTLIGIELLGDAQMAPGIVQTLGYVQGSFYTRGAGTDFAMYHPLGDSTLEPPTYFGLAFD